MPSLFLSRNELEDFQAAQVINQYKMLEKLYPYSAERIISEMQMDGGACECLDWNEIWERLNHLIKQDKHFEEVFGYEPIKEKDAKPLIIDALKKIFRSKYPQGSGTGRSVEEMLNLF